MNLLFLHLDAVRADPLLGRTKTSQSGFQLPVSGSSWNTELASGGSQRTRACDEGYHRQLTAPQFHCQPSCELVTPSGLVARAVGIGQDRTEPLSDQQVRLQMYSTSQSETHKEIVTLFVITEAKLSRSATLRAPRSKIPATRAQGV